VGAKERLAPNVEKRITTKQKIDKILLSDKLVSRIYDHCYPIERIVPLAIINPCLKILLYKGFGST